MKENTIKNTTDFEIEIMRHNVTPAQFLYYVRSRVDARGGKWYRGDLELSWFAGCDERFDRDYSFGLPGEKGAAAEVIKDKPYDKQNYIMNFDGSVYNEIVEFDFDDEKTGHGYYYLVNKSAVPGCEESNKRFLIKGAKEYNEREIERIERKIAKKNEYLDRERAWLDPWWVEREERDIEYMREEIKNRRDDIAECDEILAEHTEGTQSNENTAESTFENLKKSEIKKAIRYFEKKHPGASVFASGFATHPQTEDDSFTGFQTVSVELWNEEERESYTVYLAVCLWDRRRTFVMNDAETWYREPTEKESVENNTTVEEVAENKKGEKKMKEIIRFEIGKKYFCSGLYTGARTLECIGRTADNVTFCENWISEDSGEACRAECVFNIEVEQIANGIADVERVEVWEYRGEKGYMYAANEEDFDRIYAYDTDLDKLHADMIEAGEIEEEDFESTEAPRDHS